MLNDIQRQKIQNFNSIVNNRNENVAINYLNQANWNEARAIELYYDSSSLSNSMSQNSNQPPNPLNNYRYVKAMKECHFYNDNSSGLLSQAFSYLKTTLGIKNNNSELCDNLNGIVNGLVRGSNEFINELRNKKGIIILYSPETYQNLIDNILLINKEYIFDTIIYPIINNSDEGENLIQQLNINKFPCYLFCKYKNERIFYVTDIIQQKLNINQFKNCLSQLDQMGNNNNNYLNNINQPRYDIDNNWQYHNQYNDNRINNNNNYNYGLLNNSGIQPNSQNYHNNININNNNHQNYPKSEIKINPSQKDSNSNNINNKKEYIPDYRDYDLDGTLSFSYLNQSNNNSFNYGLNNSNNNFNNNSININNSNNNFDNNYNINNSYNSFNDNNINISDSLQNIPITDSFIRKKQDDEMKRLEEMEEEKERKEKEEQEKKRIDEEKEKEKLKIEKEEKEIFSQLIPPEPDDSNPDKCIIIFRLPDGQKNIQRKFLKNNKISLLYDFIKSLGREIYTEGQYNNFSIIQTFPFKNFEDKLNNTLEEEGLYPNSVLQIKENN